MIDIERRLQHAARELREIEIEPPPLEHLGVRRRTGVVGRIPALVMPVLFVVGGLALVAGGMDPQVDGPTDAPVVDAVEQSSTAAPEPVVAERSSAPTLTARQEIALISSLRPSPTPAPPGSVAGPSGPSDVRTLAQRYR